MRILLLTQYYYPEPVEKVHDLACGLVKAGHKVTVLTGNPCYPKGKFYKGYRNFLKSENIDGVKVIRVPQFPDHSRSVIRRVLYYISFAFSALIFGIFTKRRHDIILVYLAALPIGLTGWVLSKAFKIPFILDVVDLWPESVLSSGILKSNIAKGIILNVARFVYHRAQCICTVTEGFKTNIVNQGIEKAKIHVIPNWMPSSTYISEEKVQKETILLYSDYKDKFIVMYAGNIGSYQNIGTIVNAAEILRKHEKICFLVVGDGVEYRKLIRQSEVSNLDNIFFLGRKKPEEMLELYSVADVLVVHLLPSALGNISIPSKTYAYMASGKPILMAVKGEAQKFAEKNGIGVTVPPADPSAMAEGILRLFKMPSHKRKHMGDRTRENYKKYYCSEIQIQKFDSILNLAIKQKQDYS